MHLNRDLPMQDVILVQGCYHMRLTCKALLDPVKFSFCPNMSKVFNVPLDKRLLAESSVASMARALPTPWCGALWPSGGLSSEAV